MFKVLFAALLSVFGSLHVQAAGETSKPVRLTVWHRVNGPAKTADALIEVKETSGGSAYGTYSTQLVKSGEYIYWLKVEVERLPELDSEYHFHVTEWKSTDGENGLGIAELNCATPSLEVVPSCWTRTTEISPKFVQTLFGVHAIGKR